MFICLQPQVSSVNADSGTVVIDDITDLQSPTVDDGMTATAADTLNDDVLGLNQLVCVYEIPTF